MLFRSYPWIYATQAGWWGLTDAETARLREYLQRGGFLVVDDFWGPEQWEVFRQTMERVLPNRPITDIAESDSVMHVLYDILEKDRTFINRDASFVERTGRDDDCSPTGGDRARLARYLR